MGIVVPLLSLLRVAKRCHEEWLAGISPVSQQYARELTCEYNMSSSQPHKYSDIPNTDMMLKVVINRGCVIQHILVHC